MVKVKGTVMLKCKTPGCLYEFRASGRSAPFSKKFKCPECGGSIRVIKK